MATDPKILEKLKADNPGRVHELTAPGVTYAVVVKAPSRGAFKAWQAGMQDDRKRIDATETLLRSCILHPDATAVDAMLEDQAGLAFTFGEQLLEIAGIVKGAEKKAL